MKGERCAIDVYKRLLDTTRDKDEVTSKIVLEILDDEVEHEADLQTILEDIDILKKMWLRKGFHRISGRRPP